MNSNFIRCEATPNLCKLIKARCSETESTEVDAANVRKAEENVSGARGPALALNEVNRHVNV